MLQKKNTSLSRLFHVLQYRDRLCIFTGTVSTAEIWVEWKDDYDEYGISEQLEGYIYIYI